MISLVLASVLTDAVNANLRIRGRALLDKINGTRINQLEDDLKGGRIGDPEGLIPLLDKIIQDQRVLEYARQHAEQIKNRLLMPIKGK